MSGLVLRGRSRELERAVAALRGAADRGQGSVMLVAGEAGIGKTALLRAVHRHAEGLGFAVGYGKADEVSQIAPGAPVLHALRSGSRPLLDDASFRGLADLYEKPLWLVEGVADLLESRAQQVPLLIVVDDLQWADRLSRFALRVLAGRLVASPVVWLVAGRGRVREVFSDFDALGEFEGASVERLELSPLTDADVMAVASDILGGPPVGRGAEWLRMVGGSPLLAVQLAEGMALDRALGRSGDALPTALAPLLRSRIGMLGVGVRAALQLAAVWGRALDVLDAARMLGADPAPLGRALSGAAALGLVDEPTDPIEFRHDLFRELVYGDLSGPERTRLHGLCAAHLVESGSSALEAAPHAREAVRRGDRGAVEILRRAAHESIDSIPQSAAQLILEAFEGLPRDDPGWFELGEQCADLLTRAQRGADAVTVIDGLLARCTDPEQRGRLQVLAARALWLTGSAQVLAARVDQELSFSTITEPARARLEASRSLALSRIDPGEAAASAAESALARGRELHDRPTEILATQALGEVAKNEGRHLAAYRVFHRLRTSFGQGFLADEITSLQFIDRFDEAQTLLVEVSRGSGRHSTAELPSLLCAQLWQDFKLAAFDAAVADAQTLLAVGEELGTYVHRLDARVVMSTVAVVHGDLERARGIVALAEDELVTQDAVQAPGLVLARARIAAAELDFDEGVRLLRPLLATDVTAKRYWPRLLDQMRLGAGLAVAAGDHAFAQDTVEQAAAAALLNPGVASFAGVALQVRGYVTGDHAALGGAVELLRRSPRAFMLAQALSDHGGALLRAGRNRQAVGRLEEAWSIFDGLRASTAAAQVQELLDASGAPVRARSRTGQRPVTGWGALTDAEARVARLIGAGHTNRSAAETLGVSMNTVATHLRSVFLKMAVRSRVQLVNAMRAAGELGP
ncbi:MAG TPA: AAA family ATPase [Pseudonocardia sp.]